MMMGAVGQFITRACLVLVIFSERIALNYANTQEIMMLTLDNVLEQTEAMQESMEGECLSFLNGFEEEKEIPSGVVHPKHLTQAMRRGWWSCAHRIVECLAELDLSFENDFNLESRSVNVHLNKLKSLVMSAKKTQDISPAFQWAQSPDEIYLNVKFAHKLDAPATINAQKDEITITDNRLVFRASQDHKHFKLDLTFWGEVDSERSSWKMGSAGTASLTLRKRAAGDKWPALLDPEATPEKPANMHIWWSMQENFDEKFESMWDEKDEEEEEGKGNEKKDKPQKEETPKKKKKSSKKKKKEVSPEDKEFRRQMKLLDDELRAEKKKIDEEMAAKKKEIEAVIRQRKDQLEKMKKDGTFKMESGLNGKMQTAAKAFLAWVQNNKGAYASGALCVAAALCFVLAAVAAKLTSSKRKKKHS
uniref:CS domain-containing protein n=1 Tax=Heterosigma akashiwo TaxID=2829 RepID=A0A7S4D729_HETAK